MEYHEKEHNLRAYLRSCHCLTSDAKECDEEPDCLELTDSKLYYDEGNESIKAIDGLGREHFWNEIPIDERTRLVDEYEAVKWC